MLVSLPSFLRRLAPVLGVAALLPALALAQTRPGAMGGGYDGYNRNQAAAEDRNRATQARTAADAQRAASSPGSSLPRPAGASGPAIDPNLGDRLRAAQASGAARDLEDRLEKSRQRQAQLAKEAEKSHAEFDALLRMINSPAAIAAEKQQKLEDANRERIDQLVVPHRQAWVQQGFSAGEAHVFAAQTTRYDGPSNQLVLTPNPAHAALQQARAAFAARQAGAPLEELLALARQFEVAGYTAAHQLQGLSARFPGRQRDLDLASLQALSYFWSRPFPAGFTPNPRAYNDQAWHISDAEKQEMETLFLALAAKYPAEARQAMALMGDSNNPYQRLATRAKDRDDYRAAAGYFTELLQVPYGANPTKLPAARYQVYPGYASFYDRFYGAWFAFRSKNAKNPVARFRAEEWAALARTQGVTVGKAIGDLVLGGACAATLDEPNGTGNNQKKKGGYAGEFFDSKYPAMLRQLGEAGDADALNCYAVLVAGNNLGGQAPATALPLLEKAAAAGSAWAAVNLSWATSWGLPGYADRAAGEAKLAPYLAGATPPQLVAYARILSGMEGGPKALFNREKARELATRAAEAGLPDGLLLLQELK